MREKTYLTRKLSQREQLVAEKYYYIIFYYMRYHHLNSDEWYDILIIPYIQSIKKYYEFDHLQQYSIKTIIYRTLDSARCNQYRKLKRIYKRIISYDKIENYLFYVAPFAPQINLEKEACSNLMLHEILNNLSTIQQKIIVLMLSEGLPKITIKNYLSISDYYLRKDIAVIKNLLKNIYFT